MKEIKHKKKVRPWKARNKQTAKSATNTVEGERNEECQRQNGCSFLKRVQKKRDQLKKKDAFIYMKFAQAWWIYTRTHSFACKANATISEPSQWRAPTGACLSKWRLWCVLQVFLSNIPSGNWHVGTIGVVFICINAGLGLQWWLRGKQRRNPVFAAFIFPHVIRTHSPHDPRQWEARFDSLRRPQKSGEKRSQLLSALKWLHSILATILIGTDLFFLRSAHYILFLFFFSSSFQALSFHFPTLPALPPSTPTFVYFLSPWLQPRIRRLPRSVRVSFIAHPTNQQARHIDNKHPSEIVDLPCSIHHFSTCRGAHGEQKNNLAWMIYAIDRSVLRIKL